MRCINPGYEIWRGTYHRKILALLNCRTGVAFPPRHTGTQLRCTYTAIIKSTIHTADSNNATIHFRNKRPSLPSALMPSANQNPRWKMLDWSADQLDAPWGGSKRGPLSTTTMLLCKCCASHGHVPRRSERTQFLPSSGPQTPLKLMQQCFHASAGWRVQAGSGGLRRACVGFHFLGIPLVHRST